MNYSTGSSNNEDFSLLQQDFIEPWILDSTLLSEFKNKKIFISGATGFFGKWLLGTLIAGQNKYNLNLQIYALSRNPSVFLKEHPEYQSDCIEWIQGDILNPLEFNKKIDFLIHGATEASEKLNRENPELMFETLEHGMRNILSLAEKTLTGSFLNISSGAIYGNQPLDVDLICENNFSGPDTLNPLSAYAEGKRVSEYLGTLMALRHQKIKMIHARCFAFVGPFLPLGTHFAMGNFLLNALQKEDIIIKGDGTPRRSYMYMSDLCHWLLQILVRGQNQNAYNVGSDTSLSILQLAQIVSEVSSELTGFCPKIQKLKEPVPGTPPLRYVPSIEKSQQELNLKISVNAKTAIAKTMKYYLSKASVK